MLDRYIFILHILRFGFCIHKGCVNGTGNINLKNVISTETFSIERDTGNVKLESCDAAEIYVKTDTGNVEASFISDKIVIYETDTGKVSVPKSTTGGRCEVTTDTGNIKITILP